MKKKSVILFVLWAVATSVLTCIYLALMFYRQPQMQTLGWIISLCIAGMTLAVMSLVRVNAKAEQVIWLGVVSKVLMIVDSVWGTVGLLLFVLSKIIQ